MRLDAEAQVSLIAERGRIAPYGLLGGQPGALGDYRLNPGTPQEERLFSKTAPLPRRRGDILAICAAGGGGFGDPRRRDPAAVRRDVAAGLVSAVAAARDYGVQVEADVQRAASGDTSLKPS
jgi:N-methylhydantoinase B